MLGHDTMADYEEDFCSSGSTCCGAFCGPLCKPYRECLLQCRGRTYHLEPNNGKNHLHGTFPTKLYQSKAFGDTPC